MRQSFKGANGPPLGALLQGGPVMRGELNDAPTATAAPASSSCAAWCFRNQKAPHSGALCTAYGGEIVLLNAIQRHPTPYRNPL